MTRAGGSEGPENVDATFAEIVADLRAEGIGDAGTGDAESSTAERPAEPDHEPTTWRDSDGEWEAVLFGADPADADDDEHYVPPEPPPLPKPRKGAFIVGLFLLLGLLLLIFPTVFGISGEVGMPLGMLALATGIALLLLRVKQGPPDGSDPDSGAQV